MSYSPGRMEGQRQKRFITGRSETPGMAEAAISPGPPTQKSVLEGRSTCPDADLLATRLNLHVLIVLHRKAVFYNSCALVEGIGRQIQVPA